MSAVPQDKKTMERARDQAGEELVGMGLQVGVP